MSGPRSISLRAVRVSTRTPHARAPRQYLHGTPVQPANPLPIVATGPPPAPPRPSVTEVGERAERRRRQAELLKRAGEKPTRAKEGSRPLDALRQRFWKDVSVQRTPEGLHTVHLDARAVRSPHTQTPLQLPASKPHLATAIALEWDVLTSAQQALKTHLIPLTSLAARAHDLATQDAADARAGQPLGNGPGGDTRRDIVRQLLRYLDTDTLLCWAPAGAAAGGAEATAAAAAAASVAASVTGPGAPAAASPRLESSGLERATGAPRATLREQQERAAAPIVAFLTTYVWPGVQLLPALGEDSIMPAAQPAATREVVRGWLTGLGAWELAGLERAALATKSVCVAARLVAEWSENLQLGGLAGGSEAGGQREAPSAAGEQPPPPPRRFGVEEAADACTVEVRWQTGQWGEVEDTHDVEREDLRRQLGSAVLLVSGTEHVDGKGAE